jgi:hypothetical protein
MMVPEFQMAQAAAELCSAWTGETPVPTLTLPLIFFG